MQITKFKNKIGKLRIAPNNRYMEFDDGTPFLYLGDTAWELFHRLTLEEAKHYLCNRAAKGFTVIQAVALAEAGGIDVPNANGDLPLLNNDPGTPNEAYFRHIDAIVQYAEEMKLFIGMLPTWGSLWKLIGGYDNCIFNPENAYALGKFLGERYRENPIIWILGGDAFIESEEEHAIIEAMALGLKAGDGGAHLITYHPRGPGRSSEFLGQAEWMDFNMTQSSHGAHDHDNGIFIDYDYALEPPKPTLDGEPHYEMMPVGFYYQDVSRLDRFDDYDVRQSAYWALMAGACGHTYGHNCVWQMWTPKWEPLLWANIPWDDSLDTPGAFQMGIVRQLFESYPFQNLRPAQDMIVDGPNSGGAKIRAALADKANLAFIYSPRGESFTVDKRVFNINRLKESWYDPRYGFKYYVHTTTNTAFQTYTPPTSGRGNDWILILEEE